MLRQAPNIVMVGEIDLETLKLRSTPLPGIWCSVPLHTNDAQCRFEMVDMSKTIGFSSASACTAFVSLDLPGKQPYRPMPVNSTFELMRSKQPMPVL